MVWGARITVVIERLQALQWRANEHPEERHEGQAARRPAAAQAPTRARARRLSGWAHRRHRCGYIPRELRPRAKGPSEAGESRACTAGRGGSCGRSAPLSSRLRLICCGLCLAATSPLRPCGDLWCVCVRLGIPCGDPSRASWPSPLAVGVYPTAIYGLMAEGYLLCAHALTPCRGRWSPHNRIRRLNAKGTRWHLQHETQG
jgi:hypothetical protein